LHNILNSKDTSNFLLNNQGYSCDFAEQVKNNNLVLPGYTIFNTDNFLNAYNKLAREGNNKIRVKRPNESDMQGQETLENLEEAKLYLTNKTNIKNIQQEGIVLEIEVEEPSTISIGHINIAGTELITISEQKDTKDLQGNTVFGGGIVHIMHPNSIENFIKKQPKDKKAQYIDAYNKAHRMYQLLGNLSAVCSKFSLDILQGKDSRGNNVSGIIDISSRVSGTTPAEVLALPYLINTENKSVTVDVDLEYNPELIIEKKDNENLPTNNIFVDTPTLLLTAQVVDIK